MIMNFCFDIIHHPLNSPGSTTPHNHADGIGNDYEYQNRPEEYQAYPHILPDRYIGRWRLYHHSKHRYRIAHKDQVDIVANAVCRNQIKERVCKIEQIYNTQRLFIGLEKLPEISEIALFSVILFLHRYFSRSL